MFSRISVAARFGSLNTGPRLIDSGTKARMQKAYDEVKSGRFARKLNKLDSEDIDRINAALKRLTDPRLEKAARKFAR